MVDEHFCLSDGSFVGLWNISANIVDDLRALIDLAEAIMDDGHAVFVSDAIEFVEIGDAFFFHDLYSADFDQTDVWEGVDRDTLRRLLAMRGRLEPLNVQPVAAKISKPDGQCVLDEPASGAAAIANEMAGRAEYFAWLVVGPSPCKPGEHILSWEPEGNIKIYVIGDTYDLPGYARWLIRSFAQVEPDFFMLWERAFPALLGSDNLSFNRFRGPYLSLRDDVLRHLEFLNDHFMALWQDCNMDFARFKTQAKVGFGVDFSNESVGTRGSPKKMAKRDVTFSNRSVRCELHSKIQPTVNRIHFHPPIPNIGGERILIGIFVDHLPT